MPEESACFAEYQGSYVADVSVSVMTSNLCLNESDTSRVQLTSTRMELNTCSTDPRMKIKPSNNKNLRARNNICELSRVERREAVRLSWNHLFSVHSRRDNTHRPPHQRRRHPRNILLRGNYKPPKNLLRINHF